MSKSARLACLLIALLPSLSWAQAPVRWIVPFPPGGVADITARIVSAQLGPALGQPVIVESRAGQGGMLGATVVAKGPPDGSMLLIAGQSIPTGPSLYKNLQFNPFKDLAPIAQVGATPNVLVVSANSPYKSVKELIDAAKANPGKLNYASVGNGSLQQLGAELFKRDTGVQVVHVPFKGGPELANAVASGTVDFSFDNLTSALGLIKGGRLRMLAFATREREQAFPDVPTMADAGYPNVLIHTWMGIWTTGGSPSERVTRFEREIRRIVSLPETMAQIQKTGLKVTNVGTQDFARIVQDEHAQWDKILKGAGIFPE